MQISLFLLIAIAMVAFFLGWFARGYMQRDKPAELAKWDSAGNDAASRVSAGASTLSSDAAAAAERLRTQMKS